MNEHHVARKRRHVTQKKCLHVVHFMYHVIDLKQTRGIKNVTLKAEKKIRGCRGLLGRVIFLVVRSDDQVFFLAVKSLDIITSDYGSFKPRANKI